MRERDNKNLYAKDRGKVEVHSRVRLEIKEAGDDVLDKSLNVPE